MTLWGGLLFVVHATLLVAAVQSRDPLHLSGHAREWSSVLASATPSGGPIVQTRSGPVQGETVRSDAGGAVSRWLGIPFAAPPVGAKRWTVPEPEAPWTLPRPAVSYGPACMQARGWFEDQPRVPISEDCLYLNVYAPAGNATTGRGPLPVMLFFHGGAYYAGAASFALYDASRRVARLAAEGLPTVVATANYRLGAFGYLGAEQLRDRSPAGGNSTGNWGLRDQRAALQWLQDNARAFGGDPARVTVFGQSAGAGSAACHLVSRGSAGLFARAVLESGPVAASWIARDLRTHAQPQFEALKGALECGGGEGAEGAAVACMRAAAAADVLRAAGAVPHLPGSEAPPPLAADPTALPLKWAPTVDGVELAAAPRELLRRGAAHRGVQVVVGTNANEGSIFVDAELRPLHNQQDLDRFFAGHFGEQAVPRLQQLYPASNFTSTFWAASEAYGDALMSCPARETARELARRGTSTFLYFFSHELLATRPIPVHLKVFHGSELVLVFDYESLILGTAEHQLADAFGAFWGAFAASGDPNKAGAGAGRELLTWPAYSESEDASMRLAAPLAVDRGLKRERCDFWASFNGTITARRTPPPEDVLQDEVWRVLDDVAHHRPEDAAPGGRAAGRGVAGAG